MAKFKIYHDSGVKTISNAKTIIGAKREASKLMTHGGRSVYVESPNGVIYQRKFWSSGRNFGWDKWEKK